MINRKHIPLEQFTVKIPNPANRTTAMQVTVYEEGRFYMNGRLAEQIYKKRICVSFTSDGKHLALKEEGGEDDVTLFPKSGSKKIKDASEFLDSKGIMLPARYDVWYNEKEHFWQGDHAENPMKSPSGKLPRAKKS